jgi:hypothetical protein
MEKQSKAKTRQKSKRTTRKRERVPPTPLSLDEDLNERGRRGKKRMRRLGF